MQNHNSYYYYKSAFSPEQCKKFIDYGESLLQKEKNQGRSTAATTFGMNHKQGFDKPVPPIADKTHEEFVKETGLKDSENNSYVRDSETAWFNDQWAYDMIWPYLTEANEKSGWKYDIDFGESIQFTKYGLNQFYGWHADGGSCHLNAYKRCIDGVTPKDPKKANQYTKNKNLIGKVRKISVTINLNKPGDYDGGNLKFDYGPHAGKERFHECEEIRPQGSIIFFPSYTYHQVTPITRGTRYSLVLWVCGKPFR
jgi:PKHD-type hydroxylase|tara:strand:+ start:228 stop:989 length:762 start_codon:yes stop_codon:yes gene_type:complete